MSDPATLDDYNRLAQVNTNISGYGLDTTMEVACPFCAAPRFMTYKIMKIEDAMKQGVTCKACARSARAIFTQDFNGTRFEIVQTGGSDPPTYLPPIRRE